MNDSIEGEREIIIFIEYLKVEWIVMVVGMRRVYICLRGVLDFEKRRVDEKVILKVYFRILKRCFFR